ncbi:hypothetical protein HDK64DRAFT_7632 [Phyllosticta capitalensis]
MRAAPRIRRGCSRNGCSYRARAEGGPGSKVEEGQATEGFGVDVCEMPSLAVECRVAANLWKRRAMTARAMLWRGSWRKAVRLAWGADRGAVALFVGEVKKRVWVKLSSFIIIFLFFTDSPHFGLVDIWITVILNRVVDRQRTNGGHWDAPAQIPVR